MTRDEILLLGIGMLVGLILGLGLGVLTSDSKTVDSSTVPTLATVTLSPSGMAYCPADSSVPHPTPCVTP